MRPLRSLLRRPAYSILAIITIAIGVGGVGAVASVVNGVLLRPLPFPDSHELVTVDVMSFQDFYISTSIPNYNDWRDRARVFQSYGGQSSWGFKTTDTDVPELIPAEAIIGDFFRVLEVEPQLGRFFGASETTPGTPPVAVLAYGYWQRRYAGDPGVVGRSLGLDGRPFTIVGVAPERLTWPRTDVFVNMGAIPNLPFDDRGSSFGTRIFARLHDGTSLEVARRDLDRAGREVKEQYGPETATPELRAMHEYLVGTAAGQLWLLLGAVVLVLIVAMVNVGGLLFARAEERSRELATRLALGASRREIVRQLTMESVVLAIAGGVLGLTLGAVLLRPLIALLPARIAPMLTGRVTLDPVTIVVTLGVTVIAAVIFSALPALRTLRVDLREALSAGTRVGGGMRERTRGAFVIAEVALSAVILIGAGLLLTSFLRLQNTDKGFDPAGAVTARVGASSDEFPETERWIAFYDEVMQRMRATPGVTAAAVNLLVPLAARNWELQSVAEGNGQLRENGASTLFNVVSEDYFTALGVPLVAGRPFARSDAAGSIPVAIIDETMAQRYWPGESAIGKRLTIGEQGADSALVYRTVVGVARNVRHYDVRSASRIQVYIPFRQVTRGPLTLNVTLRTTLPPASLIPGLQRTVASVDPRVTVSRASTLAAYVDDSLSGERALGTIVSWLALVALLVTAVGLIGVVSYAVVQRTREIAIRVALGARATSVVNLITRQGMTLAVAGLVIGVIVALGLARLLSGFVYGVSAMSPVVYAICAAILLAVATLAAFIPARRAARVNATVVLRGD
jgi:putative ABC transport system permease protein